MKKLIEVTMGDIFQDTEVVVIYKKKRITIPCEYVEIESKPGSPRGTLTLKIPTRHVKIMQPILQPVFENGEIIN